MTVNQLEKLAKAGIPFKLVRKSQPVFEAELNNARTRLEIQEGKDVDIRVYPNKTHRQAVIAVHEDAREITRKAKISAENRTHAIAAASSGRGFPVALPETTDYVTKLPVAELDRTPEERSSWYKRYEIEVTASVPESTVHLLVGYDEENLFVSMLPEPVASVTAAHEVLRPLNVPKGTLRQGEWFFVPVDDELSEMLDKEMSTAPHIEQNWYLEDNSSGTSDNHIAMTAYARRTNRNGKLAAWGNRTTYVIGFIIDERGTHDTLWLNQWCVPVHNLELESDSDSWD